MEELFNLGFLESLEYDSDSNVYKKVLNYQKYYNNQEEIFLEQNEIYCKNYLEIINRVNRVINSIINQDSLFEYLGALSYLVWEGYISFEHSFMYDSTLDDIEMHKLGLNVISGKGCCRHISRLFKDCLNANYHSAYYMDSNIFKIQSDYMTLNINRNDTNGLMHKDCLDIGSNEKESKFNHATILIPYKNYFYIYDPTNIMLFSINNCYGDMLVGKGKIKINPLSLVIYNNFSVDEMKAFFDNMSVAKLKKTGDKFHDLLFNGAKIMRENKELCEQLYFNSIANIENINNYRNNVEDNLKLIRTKINLDR